MSLGSPRALAGGLGGRGALPCPALPRASDQGTRNWGAGPGVRCGEGVADRAQALTAAPSDTAVCGQHHACRGQGSCLGHLLTRARLHPARSLGALGGCRVAGSVSTGWRGKSVSVLLV